MIHLIKMVYHNGAVLVSLAWVFNIIHNETGVEHLAPATSIDPIQTFGIMLYFYFPFGHEVLPSR